MNEHCREDFHAPGVLLNLILLLKFELLMVLWVDKKLNLKGHSRTKKKFKMLKFIYFSHLKLTRVLNIEKVKGKDDFEEQEKEDIKVAFRNRVFAKYIYKSGYRSD